MIDKDAVELKLSIIKRWLEENDFRVVTMGGNTILNVFVGQETHVYISAIHQNDEISISFDGTVMHLADYQNDEISISFDGTVMHLADPEIFNKLLKIIKSLQLQ